MTLADKCSEDRHGQDMSGETSGQDNLGDPSAIESSPLGQQELWHVRELSHQETVDANFRAPAPQETITQTLLKRLNEYAKRAIRLAQDKLMDITECPPAPLMFGLGMCMGIAIGVRL